MNTNPIKDKIQVTFPDGKKQSYEKSVTLFSIAKSIGSRLASSALVAKVNGRVLDMSFSLCDDASVEFVTTRDELAVEVLRHSGAHIMAQAVQRLFPGAKYAIGPTIKDGFYYDFEVEKPFHEDDLTKIASEMTRIVQEKHEFTREEKDVDSAIAFFKKRVDPYKVEIIEDLKQKGNKTVSMYTQGDFVDLCTGPHIPNTSFLKVFKLISVAGAYWRGISSNKMLQRIYATAFFKDKELKDYLFKIEEAKTRDHRKLGKELGLFSFHEEAPGFPFWHSKGNVLYNLLVDFIRKENTKRNYKEVITPVILNSSLWKRSGHYDNFKENMYFTEIDDREFALKPMNCPAHCLIYKSALHSYKELPIRMSEFGLVHRHELSGVLHGLFRVRNFTQDDAHIFCMEAQIKDEIIKIISYTLFVYKKVGFNDYDIYIATKPNNYIGSDEVWDNATSSLKQALEELGIDYGIKEGEGAFYGPKIEFNVKDSIERNWQCGTIQIDFSMPQRLEATYEGSDGKKHTPVMIHRAILGSLERFIGILIEHYKGRFPLWLAPLQVKVIPIIEKHKDYGLLLARALEDMGFRTELDGQDEKLGYKIRKAQLEKVPFMLILGDSELEEEQVSVRSRDDGDLGKMDLAKFVSMLKNEML